MATIDDAKAAFDAYHQQVSAKISELEAEVAAAQSGTASVDAQPLIDDIAAAQQEIAPAPAPAAETESASEDAGEQGEEPAPAAAEAPQIDNSVAWNA